MHKFIKRHHLDTPRLSAETESVTFIAMQIVKYYCSDIFPSSLGAIAMAVISTKTTEEKQHVLDARRDGQDFPLHGCYSRVEAIAIHRK